MRLKREELEIVCEEKLDVFALNEIKIKLSLEA